MAEKVNTSKAATAGSKRVKPRDMVTIRWTEDAKFHKAGQTSEVHKVSAEKLVAKKRAEIVKKAEPKSEE